MGTSGLFGFRKNGAEKAVYNHFDSYPERLGREFTEFVRNNIDKIPAFFDKITVIDPFVKPTDEQKEYCKSRGWFDSGVSERSDNDWYCLLRKTQNLQEWDKCVKDDAEMLIEDSTSFIKDSLFCEHAYIYDIDTGMMEYYRGFQKVPYKANRYGTESDRGYYPCRMTMAFSVLDMPEVLRALLVISMPLISEQNDDDNDDDSALPFA